MTFHIHVMDYLFLFDKHNSSVGNLQEFNPSPDMPILGSSISAANKDMMAKYRQMGIQLSD